MPPSDTHDDSPRVNSFDAAGRRNINAEYLRDLDAPTHQREGRTVTRYTLFVRDGYLGQSFADEIIDAYNNGDTK